VKAALEFHDSTVASVRVVAGDAEVLLSPAYVHRSPGVPGIDPGEGHHQAVTVRLAAASVSGEVAAFAGRLSDGTLFVSGVSQGLVPLPYSARGNVGLSLVLASGATLEVVAGGIECLSHGPTAYVEQFPG
jgi:hypothetical protein